MTSLTDVLLAQKSQKAQYLQKPIFFAKVIKKEAQKSLVGARVFIFGSVVVGRSAPSSDIDILISAGDVPKNQEDRAKITAKIHKKVGLFSPFEIHLVDDGEFSWYKKFAKLVEI